jgi:toxin ParE1/3/4
MVEIKWTSQALNDLEAIADFISRDSPHYASLFVMDITASVERLCGFPKSGRIVPKLKNPIIRKILFGNYRIVYRLKGRVSEILTVYHGSKLLDLKN